MIFEGMAGDWDTLVKVGVSVSLQKYGVRDDVNHYSGVRVCSVCVVVCSGG